MLCIESHVLGSSTECLSVGNVRVPGLDALDLVPAKRTKDRSTFVYKKNITNRAIDLVSGDLGMNVTSPTCIKCYKRMNAEEDER